MTDVGLERLTNLTNLKELTMGGNELGDAGLQALRQMTGLTYLDLSGRQGADKNVWTVAMSETGLAAVLTLKNLHELRFSCVTLGAGNRRHQTRRRQLPDRDAEMAGTDRRRCRSSNA